MLENSHLIQTEVQETCILKCIYFSRDMVSVCLSLCFCFSLSLCCGTRLLLLFILNRPATCSGTGSLQHFGIHCLVTLLQRRNTFKLPLTNVPSDSHCVYKHAWAAERVQLMVSTNDACACVLACVSICKCGATISQVKKVSSRTNWALGWTRGCSFSYSRHMQCVFNKYKHIPSHPQCVSASL